MSEVQIIRSNEHTAGQDGINVSVESPTADRAWIRGDNVTSGVIPVEKIPALIRCLQTMYEWLTKPQ
jgi:hypothetical protein